MNFCFWTLLLIVILQTLGLAQNQGNKVKSIKIKINNKNSGPLNLPKIRLQNNLRRKHIIMCCGFQKCLPPANVTVKKTSPTGPTTTIQTTTSTLSTATMAAMMTGNSAGESSSAAPTDAITIPSQVFSTSPLDVSVVPTDAPREVTTDLQTDVTTKVQDGTKSMSPSTDAVVPLKTQVFQDTTTAIDGISSKAESTSISSSTTPTTKKPTSKTPTTTPLTTTTTTTTTKTTTTTPFPCSLSCAAYNSFLANNPTSGTLKSNGTKKTSNCGMEYFVSSLRVTRNEAALRCKALNMILLTVTSLEGLECLNNFEVNTFWTSGSNEDDQCHLAKKIRLVLNGLQCDSLFDISGNLKDKKSYGIWIDIDDYTYLLGNKPMAWLDSYRQCCALGMEALNIDNAAEQLGLTALARSNKDNWTANFNYWTSGTWKGAPVKQWSWCEPNGPTVFAKGLIWESSQPDNKGGNESCVHFRFTLNTTGAIMTDRNCANKYIFACKSALKTTPKPCVVSCPMEICKRNNLLFDTDSATTEKVLRDYFSYGNWYDGCGRNFLTYNLKMSNWTAARNSCCEIGLTLASMESAGKLSCFSRIVAKYAPVTYGDFWLSGTDLGCDSNFRWCTLSRDFVDPELTWKEGHPKPGLDCVYLEVRNGSVLLATDNCAQNKSFLCEVRKRATFRRAMQTECAETWDITVATLRQIELVSQEEPVKLETGFVAYDQCSGIKSDDECVIAHETYKCGQQKAPAGLVSNIITKNYDNGTMLLPPTPCVPLRRICWLSNTLPCVKNQTAIDLINNNPAGKKDKYGSIVTSGNRTFYVSDAGTSPYPLNAYTHCCELGMHLIEPQNWNDSKFISSVIGNDFITMVGDTEFINQTHEVWCRSRTVLADNMFNPERIRYQCNPSYLRMIPSQASLFSELLEIMNVQAGLRINVIGKVYPDPYKVVSGVQRYVCEKP
ncbi:Hypothetical predicted protein [Cloeon dipterum]|uniref:C-type lectin domain-containing protein n=1 Tax=Cloeon dipterum TaxID=197152 RepID=A0A8S1DTW1_9INSE|nr:Hypothetical predicted protein [Cloeon dipterum]